MRKTDFSALSSVVRWPTKLQPEASVELLTGMKLGNVTLFP